MGFNMQKMAPITVQKGLKNGPTLLHEKCNLDS